MQLPHNALSERAAFSRFGSRHVAFIDTSRGSQRCRRKPQHRRLRIIRPPFVKHIAQTASLTTFKMFSWYSVVLISAVHGNTLLSGLPRRPRPRSQQYDVTLCHDDVGRMRESHRRRFGMSQHKIRTVHFVIIMPYRYQTAARRDKTETLDPASHVLSYSVNAVARLGRMPAAAVHYAKALRRLSELYHGMSEI